ncbi:porin [Achromobacter sp. AGC39]
MTVNHPRRLSWRIATRVRKGLSTGMATCTGVFGAVAGSGATSSLDLYGSLSQGASYISDIAGGSSMRTDVGTMQPDRFGLRGSEDVGGGLRANFLLEGGFATRTGASIVPGVLFNRNAWVGMSNGWGSVQLGHQPDFMFDVIGKYSSGFQLTNFFLFHPGNLDNLANTFQANNSIKLQTPASQRWQVGAQYGFASMPARDGPRSTTTLSTYARYQQHGFSGALAFTLIKDRARMDLARSTGVTRLFGQALVSGVPITLPRQRIWGAGGAYRLDGLPLRLNATLTGVQLKYRGRDESMRNADLGAAWTYRPRNVLNLGYSRSAFAGGQWDLFSASHVHQFSKRTEWFALVVYQRAGNGLAHAAINGVGVSSTRNQTVLTSGIHHSF